MDMYPRREQEEDFEEEVRPRLDGIYRDPRTKYPRKEGSMGTLIFIITVVVLAVAAGLLTYVFNSATVTITPKHADILDFHKTITFAEGQSTGSDVPFVVATTSVTKSKTLTLSDTKQVQSKASGKIIVYNKFDTNPQKLIKNTRFESSSGKIYRINDSITVPGMKGAQPGSVEVTVYADSYGADYNTDPADFTIPGFKGSARYTGFFARGNGAITGGASGTVSAASLSDINAAKDELALELAQEVKETLSKVTRDGYTGLYSATEVVYVDNEQEVLQGVTPTYKVTATGYLMLAEADAFAKSIAQEVREYSGDPVRLGYTETLNYTRKDTDHVAAGTPLSILVEGKPRVIWSTNEDAIRALVAGKKRDEFKTLMSSITSIDGAEISFSPLWLSSFPDEQKKIKVVESLPGR
jgi:hypothetical protein